MKKIVFLFLLTFIGASNAMHLAAQTSQEELDRQYTDCITRSFDYLEQDSLAQAEEALREAMRLQPGNPSNGMLLGNMGSIQRRLGRLTEAEQSYTIGLGFLPENLTLLTNRASLYAEMEAYDKAIDDYTSVIYHEPENEDAYYERALCRLMSQDTIGARLDLEQIDKFNPNSAKARLGMAYVYKAQRMFREAAEIYDALIERNPRSARLMRERAEVHYLNGRMAAALDDITHSINIDPHDPYSYILRAQIRYARKDREFARRDLNRALELGLSKAEADVLIQKLDEK